MPDVVSSNKIPNFKNQETQTDSSDRVDENRVRSPRPITRSIGTQTDTDDLVDSSLAPVPLSSNVDVDVNTDNLLSHPSVPSLREQERKQSISSNEFEVFGPDQIKYIEPKEVKRAELRSSLTLEPMPDVVSSNKIPNFKNQETQTDSSDRVDENRVRSPRPITRSIGTQTDTDDLVDSSLAPVPLASNGDSDGDSDVDMNNLLSHSSVPSLGEQEWKQSISPNVLGPDQLHKDIEPKEIKRKSSLTSASRTNSVSERPIDNSIGNSLPPDELDSEKESVKNLQEKYNLIGQERMRKRAIEMEWEAVHSKKLARWNLLPLSTSERPVLTGVMSSWGG